jgi:predicted RNase H-like HicB family nuclease
MKHQAVIELWDDGTYSIYVPDMKGHNLNAQGKSVEEAKENLMDAIADYVEMYKNSGKTIPEEIDSPEFEYKYDLASFFDYFDWINISKLAEKASSNERRVSREVIEALEKITRTQF